MHKHVWDAIAAVKKVLSGSFDSDVPDWLVLRALYYVVCIGREYAYYQKRPPSSYWAQQRFEVLRTYICGTPERTSVANHLQWVLTISIVLADWEEGFAVIWRDPEWLEDL